MKGIYGILILFQLFPLLGYNQACCSGGVPISGNLGLSNSSKGTLQILLSYDQNVLKTLVNETEILNDQTRTRRTSSTLLELNYGLSERLSLTTLFSFVRQHRKIQSLGLDGETTNIYGVGDQVLLFKLALTPIDNRNTVILGVGPKIPIGGTEYTNNSGLLLPADMQPGTGAFDAILWGYWANNHIISNNISGTILTSYRYTGSNKKYNNGSQTYRFGNEFQLNAGVNYRKVMAGIPIDLSIIARYRNQSADLLDKSTIPSSGGSWFFAIPGLALNLSHNYAIRFSGNIPVYNRVSGTQLTTSYKYNVALFYSLQRRKNTLNKIKLNQ